MCVYMYIYIYIYIYRDVAAVGFQPTTSSPILGKSFGERPLI